MNWVARRTRTQFARVLDENTGLHPREFGVLAVVSHEPDITQQAVGEAAGVDPSTMVATLDSVEERGLAERRTHETDRRKRAVFLTGHGEEVAKEARRLGAEVGREAFSALNANERTQLNVLLRKPAGLG